MEPIQAKYPRIPSYFIALFPDSVSSIQFSRSVMSLCDPMNRSTPGLPVHQQLPEFTQTHVHRVTDAIQPSHPLSSPSPPAPNPSQHQSLFQWVNSSHEVAKVLELQLYHFTYLLKKEKWILPLTLLSLEGHQRVIFLQKACFKWVIKE